MVWLGGVAHGERFAGPCRMLCGCRVWHSGTLTGGVQYRALLGWGLLLVRCVLVFRGDSWASADRACGLDLILMNITSTQWKQIPFF